MTQQLHISLTVNLADPADRRRLRAVLDQLDGPPTKQPGQPPSRWQLDVALHRVKPNGRRVLHYIATKPGDFSYATTEELRRCLGLTGPQVGAAIRNIRAAFTQSGIGACFRYDPDHGYYTLTADLLQVARGEAALPGHNGPITSQASNMARRQHG